MGSCTCLTPQPPQSFTPFFAQQISLSQEETLYISLNCHPSSASSASSPTSPSLCKLSAGSALPGNHLITFWEPALMLPPLESISPSPTAWPKCPWEHPRPPGSPPVVEDSSTVRICFLFLLNSPRTCSSVRDIHASSGQQAGSRGESMLLGARTFTYQCETFEYLPLPCQL